MEEIKSPSEILFIDCGFTRLGWATWTDEYQGSGCLMYRVRRENETFSHYRDERLIEIFVFFNRLLKYGNFSTIVIEQFPLNQVTTQRALGGMVFAIIRALADFYNVEWQEISASTARVAVVGTRKTTKEQIRRKITELYPSLLEGRKLTEVTFDEADAVALGHTWINQGEYEQEESKTTEAQDTKGSI